LLIEDNFKIVFGTDLQQGAKGPNVRLPFSVKYAISILSDDGRESVHALAGVGERPVRNGHCRNLGRSRELPFKGCVVSIGVQFRAGAPSVFGAGAGDVMATVQMTMLAGLPYTALRDAVIAHPTMPEGLIPLLLAVPAKPA
jgi:hypothetical protein